MSEIEYKDYIDRFFTENQKEINIVISKCIINTQYEKQDMLAELYLYLVSNQSKIQNLVDIKGKPLMRFIAQWVYNNVHLYKSNTGLSNFQAKYTIQDNEDVTVFLADVVNEEKTGRSNKYENKLIKLKQYTDNLNTFDKALFQKIFSTENYNDTQLANAMKCSTHLVKKMRNKFIDEVRKEID